MNSHKCKAKTTRAAPRAPAAASTKLIPPSAPPVIPVVPDYAWTFGEPESHPGKFSWLFVPLIRCALGMDVHGGMAQVVAGDDLWANLRDQYGAELRRTGITENSLPFSDSGYLDDSHQVCLLLGPGAGGESNIPDRVEGKLTELALRVQRVWSLRSTSEPRLTQSINTDRKTDLNSPHQATQANDSGGSMQDPSRMNSSPGGARLTIADIGEHGRLWWFIPNGCEDHWVTAARPRWQALLDAHTNEDARARNSAVDHILVLPAMSLVRKRGGRRRTRNAIRRRLVAVAAPIPPTVGSLYPRDQTLPQIPAGHNFSELERWKAKVRRAAERGSRGNTKQCTNALTQDGTAGWTEESIRTMNEKHPPATNPIPDCPDDAPYTIIDKDRLEKLTVALAKATAAGPSGWTAELLLPLFRDEVCAAGISLLVQLIANNELDAHSRRLLTTSVLHAIPKPGSDDLRPLALGEFFVKLASKYCFNLDSNNFPSIFEPTQLTVGCPGGLSAPS